MTFKSSFLELHDSHKSSGLHEKTQLETTFWLGNIEGNALTAVDFEVPFSPLIKTPPI